MQIFISYRREDTAGRAGRLFDSLSASFGARNVFQDVTAIAPGTDFGQEITAAIDRCDAVLVIIGEEWTTLAGPEGRRLDDPDDYVHREVAAALSSGVPVVPVLVGGAPMPSAAELPASLRALGVRQAVTVRDDAWHQDVETLTRRLRQEDVVGNSRRRRRWPLIVAGGAVLVAAGAVVWVLSGDDDDSSSEDNAPPCPSLNDAWSPIDVDDGVTVTANDGDAVLEFTALAAAFDAAESRAYVRLDVLNQSDASSEGIPYVGEGMFSNLLVDGLSQGVADCLSVEGDPNLTPDERARPLLGFDVSADPTGKPLVVEILSGDYRIAVTP